MPKLCRILSPGNPHIGDYQGQTWTLIFKLLPLVLLDTQRTQAAHSTGQMTGTK